MRRYSLTVALTFLISLIVGTGVAQAIVVNDAGTRYGVAMVPGTLSDPTYPTNLTGQGINPNPAGYSAPCVDPALSSDLQLQDTGLCWHGGPVINKNETFALTWDPVRRYWQTTRGYVEQYLRDVADGSGTLSSPYAVATQYTSGGNRALNQSVYGGGCVDFGAVGGSTCKFGNSNGTGAGHDYPANACTPTGTNFYSQAPSGQFTSAPDDRCLSASQVDGEVAAMVAESGLIGRTKAGNTPLVTLLLPPGVEVCLDGTGHLCSANANSSVKFCSYHSQANVGGTMVSYVVQPFTPLSASGACDDPDIPAIPGNVDVVTLAKDIGQRLVSPLSQSQLAAITDPALNSWVAINGDEINDNGCVPLGDPGNPLDAATVGKTGYFLQREFNNAGAIESDANALRCMPLVNLVPTFVVPSAVNRGDLVQLDGSTTISSLIVPRGDYQWSFGDGTSAVGPSVEHTYGKSGTFQVKLTVTDRGGNVQTLVQPIDVLGGPGGLGGDSGNPVSSAFHVRLQLMPQSLRQMLRGGLAVRVSSNENADGVATLSIPRRAAKRAHIRGRGNSVVIGRGTVSQVKAGSVMLHLHLHLSHSTVRKLQHLRHVAVTVRLALIAPGGDHVAVDAAAKY